ncbi:restriction endonuclease [Erythrobacter sp. W302b]|uniref:restriction endonuclease n=1 Tax=Erythrobacter sp. W302b TaxID=3389874 RepID=UPI00396AF117
MTRQRIDPEWRAFERLVARIERDAAGRDATVASPDRIRCRYSGRLREVDASLRTVDGKLTTIECRKRRARQDVTWIEQLATKKNSLGADHTIAVSASGFSPAARNIAAVHGIALKDLRQIEEADLNPNLNLDFVLFTHKSAALVGVELRFAASTPWTVPRPGEGDLQLDNDCDLLAPIFHHVEDGRRWSIDDLWRQLQDAVDPFSGLEKGAPPVIRSVCFPYPGTVEVDTPSGPRRLGDVVLSIALAITVEPVWKSDTAKIQYGEKYRQGLQRLEFESAHTCDPWRIALQLPSDAIDRQSMVVASDWPAQR